MTGRQRPLRRRRLLHRRPGRAPAAAPPSTRNRTVAGLLVGRQQLRHRPHRPGRRTAAASPAWAWSAAAARPRAAPASPPRSATSTPSTTWPTRWATSSPATTPSTAPSATARRSNRNAGHLGRAGQRLLDHGLRRHLRHRQPADRTATPTGRSAASTRSPPTPRAPRPAVNEVQMAALTGFDGQPAVPARATTAQLSAPIMRGTNFTAAGIKAAIEASPAGRPAAPSRSAPSSDTGFTVTFGGTPGRQPTWPAAARQLQRRLHRLRRRDRPPAARLTKRRLPVTPTGNTRPSSPSPAGLHDPGAHAVRA